MNEPTEAAEILVEEIGPIAIVRFNRPQQRNPLSIKVLDQLDALLNSFASDNNIRAIIFTGSENVFLSGADIRELRILDREGAYSFSRRGQMLMQRISAARQTVIAAVNGYCMGGGLDFALACHIRVASSPAVFAHPGARLGIITGWGGTQRLPRLIGKTHAVEMFATAKQINSEEALKLGLITEIFDPVLEGAVNLARKIVSKPTNGN
jgi:enoyl-CoA hydratase